MYPGIMYLPQFHFFQSTHVCNYTYPSDEIFRDFSTKKGKPSFGRFAALEIYTDIFRKSVGDDEEKKELSNHAIEAIERIRWLVTGMLQIAKLESGAYQMDKKELPINETNLYAIYSYGLFYCE